jgi:hypothetical protein
MPFLVNNSGLRLFKLEDIIFSNEFEKGDSFFWAIEPAL